MLAPDLPASGDVMLDPDPLAPEILGVLAGPEALLLRVALPGLEAKDIALEMDGAALTLAGCWPVEPETADAEARHIERPRGAFRRTLRVPFEIDAARVQARIERGVLEIVVPALPASRPPEIRVLPPATAHP